MNRKLLLIALVIAFGLFFIFLSDVVFGVFLFGLLCFLPFVYFIVTNKNSGAVEFVGQNISIRRGGTLIWSGRVDFIERITIDEVWTFSESTMTKAMVIIYLVDCDSFSFSARGFSREQLKSLQDITMEQSKNNKKG